MNVFIENVSPRMEAGRKATPDPRGMRLKLTWWNQHEENEKQH